MHSINWKGTSVFVFSILVLTSSLAKAKNFKELEKVSLKCSVELVGGKITILYYHGVPTRQVKFFKESLYNKKLSNNNVKIHKVEECVEFDKDFINQNSNRLHKKLLQES